MNGQKLIKIIYDNNLNPDQQQRILQCSANSASSLSHLPTAKGKNETQSKFASNRLEEQAKTLKKPQGRTSERKQRISRKLLTMARNDHESLDQSQLLPVITRRLEFAIRDCPAIGISQTRRGTGNWKRRKRKRIELVR